MLLNYASVFTRLKSSGFHRANGKHALNAPRKASFMLPIFAIVDVSCRLRLSKMQYLLFTHFFFPKFLREDLFLLLLSTFGMCSFQVQSGETLPLVYDPAIISSYWGKRPRAVATRIVQLLSVAGGFLSRIAWDVINKKVKEVKF